MSLLYAAHASLFPVIFSNSSSIVSSTRALSSRFANSALCCNTHSSGDTPVSSRPFARLSTLGDTRSDRGVASVPGDPAGAVIARFIGLRVTGTDFAGSMRVLGTRRRTSEGTTKAPQPAAQSKSFTPYVKDQRDSHVHRAGEGRLNGRLQRQTEVDRVFALADGS